MQRNILSALLILTSVLMLSSCSESESAKYHPNIQAYTSGTVSRYAPVSISFTEELPAEKQTQEFLEKNIKISPSVDVKFSVIDNYIVSFVPEGEYERDTEYKVTLKMDKFIETLDDNLSRFSFTFKTLPLMCHGSFGALEIDDDDKYGTTFTLVTADKESSADAESLVTFSEKPSIDWEHDATGRIHKATLSKIEAGAADRDITYTLTNSGEYPSTGSIRIPDRNDFSVYDIVVREGSERCVYIYFTKNLDAEQDITGLAYIDGNTNERMVVERNCIRIYYDENLKGQVNIMVNKGIKSSKGLTLTENQTFQRTLGGNNKPSLEFVSQGAILPLSSNLTIQFKSTYLKGVIVRVIEVPQSNMGQFLQSSNLDGEGELRRVGRLVNQELIFLDDDPTVDLTEPHIFSINLNKLFTANPGALYRIELSTYSALSLYPCADAATMTKAELKAMFDQKFALERSQLEGEGYYYYFTNGDPNMWWEGEDPCKPGFYENVRASKSVVATNLGLTVKSGAAKSMSVWVNNLITTAAEGGVEVKLYNYQHGVTGEGRTDADGFAEIAYSNGKPFYIIATKEGDVAYMRVDDGSSLSLSDFDTEGKVLQSGLNGFIYGDRGVWRPGDTLHVCFMLGDRAASLPKEHPVILELTNPLGQVHSRRTLTKGVMGVYAFNIPIAADAPTGMWVANISVGGASFTKYLRIETIMPNRLKVAPDFGKGVISRGKSVSGSLHTEWLNGAVARGYKYDIQAKFITAPTAFKAYKNYSFTQLGASYLSEESSLITGIVDGDGNADLNFTLQGGAAAPGLLNAVITTKVYEPSGQYSIDVQSKQYSPYTSYVGVSTPQKGNDALDTDKEHPIRFATVDALGNPVGGKRLSIKMYKVSWYWWWNSDDSYLAEYASNSYNQAVVTETLTTDNAGDATLNFTCRKADWGTYLIVVKNLESGHSASTMAYFDWPGNPERYGNSTAATRLSFTTEKDSYNVGDVIKFAIPSVKGAKALVTVENGSRVLSAQIVECDGNTTQVSVPVTADMRPNIYIYVSLIQPYAQTENDLPMRLYGVAAVTVNDPDSYLYPVIDAKEEILPNQNFSVKVSEKGGKEMAYTIAIVDEGLLDLTHFKTPNPWNAFNAREALGVRTWDAYNMVIGAYGGKIEQMFSIGGDEDALASGAKALVNRFTPVVKFAGPFHLKASGSKTHSFYMPNYNGKVRVMVVAGNGSAYGSGEKSILVRQPVMVIGTLPRVIGQGEEITVPATVFATKDNVGDVKVSIECSGKFTVQGDKVHNLNFSKTGDAPVTFNIAAGNTPGTGIVTIKAVAGGCESTYSCELEVRSIADEITRLQDLTIAAGKEWKGTPQAFGIAGTNSLTVELSGTKPLNLSSRMDYLIGYPHGCVEQTVSKAFPQIYLSTLTQLNEDEQAAAENAVKGALDRLSSYQLFDGSLAYWPGSSYTNQWGTIYAAHFVTEAEKAGYSVPSTMRKRLFNYLKKSASADITTQAYRLYVLGLSGNSDLSALNRLKEEANGSLSKWLVAGAYALAGRKDMCERFISATSDFTMDYSGANPTFGSDIRDAALRLQVLCLLDRQSEAITTYNKIVDNLASSAWYSTQDVAVSLASAAQFQKKYGKPAPAKGSVVYDGNTEKFNTTVGFSKQLYTDADAFGAVTIKNTGSQPLYVHFVQKGYVKGDDTEAASSGLGIAVTYTDANYAPIDVTSLAQGTNFIATVTVKNTSALDYSNIAVTQIIPSGWEILNTRFASDAADAAQGAVSYQDMRDDRILSYIDLLPSGKQTTMTIKLTASYKGSYTLPSVKAEAMYNSQINARTAAGKCLVK